MSWNAGRSSKTIGRTIRKGTVGMTLSFLILFFTTTAHAGWANSPGSYLTPSIRCVCNALAGKVSLEDADTGDLIKSFQLPTGAKPVGIVFLNNPPKLYVADNNLSKLYVIGLTVRKAIALPFPPIYIAMDPKGRFVYAGTWVVDTSTDTVLKDIPMDGAGSRAFTPDGTRAYVSLDGSWGSLSQIKVIDTSTHTVLKTIQLPIPTSPQGVAMHPTGKRLYVACWMAHNVTIIDTDPASPTYNTVLGTIPISGAGRGIAMNPSGSLCYVALDTGGVDCIITTPSSSQYHTVVKHISNAGAYNSIHDVAFSIDGKTAHVSVFGRNEIFVIDSDPLSDTFNQVIRTDIGDDAMGIAFLPKNLLLKTD